MIRNRATARLGSIGRGSVALIALLMISSAALRLVSGVAMAEDSDIAPLSLPSYVMTTDADHSNARATKNLDRAEMGSLLDALRAREADVTAREARIELRQKALEAADAEITRRLAALEQAEAALRSTLSLADGAAEDDLSRLTAVYESMKPKDAAALFETMEPGFAAGFLGRMRPDTAAAIMTGLSPEIAYSISVILAGRNANVPKT